MAQITVTDVIDLDPSELADLPEEAAEYGVTVTVTATQGRRPVPVAYAGERAAVQAFLTQVYGGDDVSWLLKTATEI